MKFGGYQTEDFFDEMFISITDPTGTVLGKLYCPDSTSITIDSLPPNLNEARVLRWRSVIQASLEADYIV